MPAVPGPDCLKFRIMVPGDAARWHLMTMFAPNIVIKCHLGEELLHPEQFLHGADAEEQQECGSHSHIKGCTSRARPWNVRIRT